VAGSLPARSRETPGGPIPGVSSTTGLGSAVLFASAVGFNVVKAARLARPPPGSGLGSSARHGRHAAATATAADLHAQLARRAVLDRIVFFVGHANPLTRRTDPKNPGVSEENGEE
jgi:hypothetical protein